MAAQMLSVPRSAVKVVEGRNARKPVVDKELEGLRLSVRRSGILVPLLVQANGSGDTYELVAGHRRLRVAELEKIDEIPIRVLEPGEDPEQAEAKALEATAIENLQREQLDPVEEARAIRALIDSGYTEKGAAEALSLSEQLVKDRLPILELPEKVQASIADRTLPVSNVPDLVVMARVSPKLCEVAVAYFLKHGRGHTWQDVAVYAVEDAGHGKHGLWSARSIDNPGERLKGSAKKLGLKPDDLKRMREMKSNRYGWDEPYTLRFSAELVQEALNVGTAYGEAGTEFRTQAVYVTTEAYADALRRQFDADSAAYEKRQQEKAKSSAKTGGAGVSDKEKAKRQAENQRRREAAVEARGINLKMGADLLKNLGKVKWDNDTADVVIALLLTEDSGDPYYGREGTLNDYAARGLSVVFEDWQVDETATLKSGKRGVMKIRYLGRNRDRDELGKKAWAWFRQAKTPEEKLGRLMIVLAAAEFALQEPLTQAQQIGSYPFGRHWASDGRSVKGKGRKALAKIAKPALGAAYKRFVAEHHKGR